MRKIERLKLPNLDESGLEEDFNKIRIDKIEHDNEETRSKINEIINRINERDNEIDYERIARRDAVDGK